jgi:hypothetical protein
MIFENLINIQRNLRAKLSYFFNEKQFDENKDKKLIKELIFKSKKISKKNKKNYIKTHKIFSQNVLNLIQEKKLSNFLQISFIQKMFFVHNRFFLLAYLNELKRSKNWFFWKKLIIEEKIGNPVRYFLYPKSSGNKIFQIYHIKKYTDFLKTSLKGFDVIFEFGGGYGNLANTFQKINKNCKYIIFDTPEVNLLQYYYLKKNNVNVSFYDIKIKNKILLIHNLKNFKKLADKFKNKKILFIANWSLSETPLSFRKKIFPIINLFDFQLISYQSKFEDINNIKYFKIFNENNILKKRNSKIIPITKLKNNYYLFSKK